MSPGALAAAFGAGVLSFATPCVLPLVPAYLAAVGGASVDDLETAAGWRRRCAASRRSCSASASCSSSSARSSARRARRSTNGASEIAQASGILIVAMGLVLTGALPTPALPGLTGGSRRPHSAVVLGGAFALSWTPCVGPVLAAVLALASTRGGAAEAALLLGAYAAGLALPLILSALAFGRVIGAAAFLRDRYDVIRVVSGIVLVVLGLLVFFDRVWWLSVAVNRVLRTIGLDALAT